MTAMQWSPKTLLETSGSYWKTSTLHAAVKLDVFTVLGDSAMAGEAIAGAIGAPSDPTCRLLNALAAMDLITVVDGRFANTEVTRRFLSRDSEHYLGYIIRHHHQLVASWARLDEAVLRGLPVRERMSMQSEDARESFLMGMFNLAMNIAPRLVSAFDASDRRHLLDLGGGPGTYAIHFCRHYPDLKATVFDLPGTQPFASRTISRFGLSDRITFHPGDYSTDAIPGGFDLAWLSHILHAEGPEACDRLIQKASDALVPGGILAVHDFILDDTRTAPGFATLFSLNMLIGTAEGRSYTEGEIRGMMTRAGLTDIRRIPVVTPNDSGVILGAKT